MNNSIRRLPPFGKTVSNQTEIRVYTGPSSWSYKEHCHVNPAHLILPPNVDPAEFVWPVHDRDVLVVDTTLGGGDVRLLRLITALHRDGAVVVRALHGSRLAIFRSAEVCHVS